MKKIFITLAITLSLFVVSSPASALTDVIQFNTGYFTPDETQTYNSPYYRWYNEDWGWQHNAISGSFTTATLSISAWDVDFNQGEFDKIYLYDNGVKTYLGTLAGASDQWSYTTFTLASNYFDDISNGLKVYMDIDVDHNSQYWAVALAKSVLTLDGGTLPNPNPGTNPVPEPSTFALLGLGLAGAAFMRRKLNKK
jgi:hypothetical protein